jgi:hypothetical protein
MQYVLGVILVPGDICHGGQDDECHTHQPLRKVCDFACGLWPGIMFGYNEQR